MFYIGSDNMRKNEFADIYIPKEWKIITHKADNTSKIYRIYSRDFFKSIFIIQDEIAIDEKTIRTIVKNLQIANLDIDEYTLFFNKKIENKMACIRFVKENDRMGNIADVIVRKSAKSDIAFIYMKGGMYIKSRYGKDEPIDVNAVEFISKFDK
jgi:hypothetical protein